MHVYWFLFVLALLSVYTEKDRIYNGKKIKIGDFSPVYAVTLFLIFILVGFRHEVGGDWFSYLDAYERMDIASFRDVLTMSDPGYRLLNYLSYNLGFGIYGVNLVCGLLFLLGLNSFCQMQPRPSLALLAAIPYLVIVISMGYTRQSVAIGLSMLAFYFLIHRGLLGFITSIVIASLFHKTAIILIPVALLMNTKHKIFRAFLLLVLSLLLYFTLLSDSVDALYKNYVLSEYHSTGALIRVLMCFFPAIFFLTFKNKFKIKSSEYKMMLLFSYASVVCLFLLLVSPATTAIDRIALYLLPLQLFVISHIPRALGGSRFKGFLIYILVLYCFFVQFTWLFAGRVSYAWIPYKFYPFEVL
ncbi:EpsG family protein [Parahaliea sp. F7430]|uniref:EpsG family protein n=1 Tax=Sediminihaliea albiluteola TaxID=2758564 RepID=A0A7W2YIQ3_9GAMM|nr:EpsG family protein [Sediminihaliea albiluteola]MBA6412282.1 EpsG family protein [Sediminihaliea albiluteola]